MRVYEYDGFILDDGRLSQLDYGWFILYATRDLRLGEEVLVREESYLYMDDTWVAIYPNGVPAYSFASDMMTALAQTDTALLVSAPGADYPFMEGRARASVETEKASTTTCRRGQLGLQFERPVPVHEQHLAGWRC